MISLNQHNIQNHLIKTKYKIYYLSLTVHIATIPGFEVKVLCDICVNEDPHKSTIRHHKLVMNIREHFRKPMGKKIAMGLLLMMLKQYLRDHIHIILPAGAQMCWRFITIPKLLPQLELITQKLTIDIK